MWFGSDDKDTAHFRLSARKHGPHPSTPNAYAGPATQDANGKDAILVWVGWQFHLVLKWSTCFHVFCGLEHFQFLTSTGEELMRSLCTWVDL